MKCAVAIVLAFIGMVVANPVAPYGLGYASPYLLPSAVSVSSNLVNHGYSKVITPVTVPILKSVPIIRTPVLAPPLSVGYPGIGYGWGGYGLGGYGLGGYGGLGWGKGALGWGGVGYGKGWH